MGAGVGTEGSGGEPQDAPICRICLEEGKLRDLIAPCKCTGTQQHVHAKCLRRWQETVRADSKGLGKRDARASRCSVCQSLYTLKPPALPLRQLAGQHLTGAAYLVIAAWLSLCLEGGAWRRWVLGAVVAFCAVRLQMLGLAALVLWALLPLVMHHSGFRPVLQMDENGRPALALVHHGAAVPDLGVGSLLIATPALDNSIFARTVVAITQHNASGTRGVLISNPLGGYLPLGRGQLPGIGASPAGGPGGAQAIVRHFHGGPVGARGRDGEEQHAVLHSMPVAGSELLFTGTASSLGLHMRQGGSVASVMAAARQALAEDTAEELRGPGEGYFYSSGAERRAAIHLYWGVCSWVPGQLAGELRHGAWRYGPGTSADVLSHDPASLWPQLAHQDRFQVHRR